MPVLLFIFYFWMTKMHPSKNIWGTKSVYENDRMWIIFDPSKVKTPPRLKLLKNLGFCRDSMEAKLLTWKFQKVLWQSSKMTKLDFFGNDLSIFSLYFKCSQFFWYHFSHPLKLAENLSRIWLASLTDIIECIRVLSSGIMSILTTPFSCHYFWNNPFL